MYSSRWYKGQLISPRTPDMAGCVWEAYLESECQFVKADTLAGIKELITEWIESGEVL